MNQDPSSRTGYLFERSMDFKPCEQLYLDTFSEEERMHPEVLALEIESGEHLLFVSYLGEQLAAFSLALIDFREFVWLSYLVVEPTFRNKGVGFKHVRRLGKYLHDEFPGKPILFEVESPYNTELDEEERDYSSKRKHFYEYLGARVLFPGYRMPSLVDGKLLPAELMAFGYPCVLTETFTRRALVQIYERIYRLSHRDAKALAGALTRRRNPAA